MYELMDSGSLPKAAWNGVIAKLWWWEEWWVHIFFLI